MKKLLSAFLSLAMVLSLLGVIPFTASADTYTHGDLDANTYYELRENGTLLYVLGRGGIANAKPMPNYDGIGGINVSPFINNTEIKKVKLFDVASVGSFTFYGCTGITEVEFAYETVTEIEMSAFDGCTSLNSIKFKEDLTRIDYSAFSDCDSLTEVKLPASVKAIANNAFYHCDNLKRVDIPNPSCIFVSGAFAYCASLTGFTMPTGVSNNILIDNKLFLNCASLTTVSITPGISMTLVNTNAFSGCDALTDIYFNGTKAQWDAIVWQDGNDSAKNATVHFNSIWGYCGENAEFVYNTGTKTLTVKGTGITESYLEKDGEEAPWYSYKDDITDIVIEEGITRIMQSAFVAQTNLKSISIPKSLTVFSADALRNSEKLTDIYYAGTKSEWESTSFDDQFEKLGVTVHYGAEEKTGDLDGDGEVTDQDAVYLLFYTFFPDAYPVNQPVDFDGSGAVDDQDAVYLLFYTFFPDAYPI